MTASRSIQSVTDVSKDNSENGFWDRGSFYSRVVVIPRTLGTSTADTVGLTALGVVAASVAVTLVSPALEGQRKRRKQLEVSASRTATGQ
ncbi:hypothetical protein KCP77_13395 [Salmonella enterica subsp. enterica]|nr:hypothetical protein KCP77_13395 [Salmonella enterica subsp. enterica]